MVLFGDLKQLPPASSQAPFIVLPIVQSFDFRVLRQNRRVVRDARRQPELDQFHRVLTDISLGTASTAVRQCFGQTLALVEFNEMGAPKKNGA